jgi:hypothetical protein
MVLFLGGSSVQFYSHGGNRSRVSACVCYHTKDTHQSSKTADNKSNMNKGPTVAIGSLCKEGGIECRQTGVVLMGEAQQESKSEDCTRAAEWLFCRKDLSSSILSLGE